LEAHAEWLLRLVVVLPEMLVKMLDVPAPYGGSGARFACCKGFIVANFAGMRR
jgi:hypothetical protein